MSTQVLSPFPFFTDRKGKPLDQGYVYVGEVDKDPELFPQAVYWDEELTLPAAQPLRTENGFVVNGGVYSTFYTDGPYSIRVRERLGNAPGPQAFYRTNVTDLAADLAAPTGASMVGFSQAGSGAVARTIQTKLREYVSVEDYASSGDFGEWLNRAISAASPGQQILIPADSSAFTWTTPVADGGKNVRIYGGTDIRPYAMFTGAETALTLTGWGSSVEGFCIEGDRTDGQILLSVSGNDTCIDRCFFLNSDILIQQPMGAGSYIMYNGLRLGNAKSIAMDIQDGVSPHVFNTKYDTDLGSYTQPSVAGIRCWTEDLTMLRTHLIRASASGAAGLLLEGTVGRDLKFFKGVACDVDSCAGIGVKIVNNTVRPAFQFDFASFWIASCAQGFLTQGSGILEAIDYKLGQVHNNLAEGFRLEAGSNITIDTNVWGNNAGGSGASAIYTSGPGLRSFRGKVGRGGSWTAQAYDGVFADSGTTDIDIDGLTFDTGGFTNQLVEVAGTVASGIVKFGRNPGFVTEAHGTAAIAIGNNSVTVNHGLSYAPKIQDVVMTPRGGGWGGAGQQFWVENVSSTQIVFRTVSSVSSNDFNFSWTAKVLAN